VAASIPSLDRPRDTHRRRKSIQLIGRRSPRRFHWPVFALILAFALLAAACGRVVAPQGWAGPSLSADGKTLYASIERGKMAALDSNMAPETGAQCDNATDDDGDGAVNEGCPKAGQKSEEHDQCLNDTNDDQNNGVADDSSVNDGCPATLVRWIFPPDTDEGNKLKLEGIYGAPVQVGGAIYFGAYDSNVYALDAAAGTPLWRFETDDPIVSALAVRDGTIYATSTDGGLYAIDAATGGRKGSFDTGSSIWSSPLLVEDVVYVAAMDGQLYALDANTLKPISGFSFKTNAGLLMDPTLADKDTLLVGGIDHKLYALDPKTGKELWPTPFEGRNWFWANPLVQGDRAIVPDLDGNVYAVNLKDGTALWTKPFEAGSPVRSAPLLAGTTVLIVDQKGNAFGINPGEGSRLWGPTLLGKTVLSDPLLLQSQSGLASPAASAALPGAGTASPSPSPSAVDTAAPSPSPAPTTGATAADEVLIVAQGGDLCRLNPVDGTPTAPALCAEVPL
jgi:eukaryotic-like serine/threonine-protein kinase